MKKNSAPKTVNEYIQSFPVETQRLLEEVRAEITRIVPDSTERISYGIPTFDLNGQYFIYVAGWQNHISVYPISAAAARALTDQVKPYLSGKGTLKFPLTEPLPLNLICQFIKIRQQEVLARSGAQE